MVSLSRSSHCVPGFFFPLVHGVGGGISCDNSGLNCQHATLHGKYSTTLLEELTSWTVDAITFSFLAARFRATLRGLLGGAGILASKLAGCRR
jgi:hypothetical protein